ncbi:MAG: choice-of-anchor I family protein [Methylococcales bacterium]
MKNDRKTALALYKLSLKFYLAVVGLSMALSLTAEAGVRLEPIGTFKTGVFASGAAEIVSHDPASQRLFVINASSQAVDIIDIANPANPVSVGSFDITAYGEQANSVAVNNGVVVAVVEANPKQDPGRAVFFNAATGVYINDVVVGALPDMVTYTPDGTFVLVANEGEPSDDYTNDPEGSVSIIDLRDTTPAKLTQSAVKTAGFTQFNNRPLPYSIRVFGPGSTVAQDFEPEYISVYQRGNRWRAMVTLQENNAIAEIDVAQAQVRKIHGLGFKNHSKAKNALDASDKDNKINIRRWPVRGMYQPDSIASYTRHNRVFFVTANEGDARDYAGFSEEVRIKDLVLDPEMFPDAATLQLEENLGRLKSTIALGDWDNDGDHDYLFSYGARSFSIWNRHFRQTFDSASDIAHITSTILPDDFNSDDEENASFDNRSDDKGAEPEGVAIGEIDGRTYGFIGLERTGGILTYDITNPYRPFFVNYVNTRDFHVVAGPGTGGDMSPEGLAFISAADSPNGKPLLVVSFEVSGSTTIFEIKI